MASDITSTTRLIPIIGAPVAGVFSPPAFNAWFKENDIDCRMMALEIPPEGLASFLQLLRTSSTIIGCSVTYPHKQAAFEAVDELTPRAGRLGALNTIKREADGRLTGDATDGEAMCVAILRKGGKISGACARIIGAGGGAGQAIVDALCNHGISRLAIEETDAERKAQIKELLRKHWSKVQIMEAGCEADILINASTIGKNTTDPSPFGSHDIAAAQTVCDVVTVEGGSQLTMLASQLGKIIISGSDMGADQLPLQLAFLGLSDT